MGKRQSKSKENERGFQAAVQASLGLFLFGLIFTVCSSIPLWFAGQSRTLTCERVESSIVDCTLTTDWFEVIPLGEQPIKGLRSAAVDTSCSPSDDDDGCTYGISLETSLGPVSMTGNVTSGTYDQKERVVEQINNFVNDREETTLQVVQSDIGWVLLLGLILPGAGSLLLLGSLVTFFRVLFGFQPQASANPAAPKTQQISGCQIFFTIITVLIAGGLLFGAFQFASLSQETICTPESHGWSEGVFVNIRETDMTFLLNDTTIPSTFAQIDPSSSPDWSAVNQEPRACWVNPWFTGRVSLSVAEMPAGHIYWGLIAAALLIGGFSVANFLSILTNPVTPPGTYQAIRLSPDGGSIGSQIVFLGLMSLALFGAIYATYTSARLSLAYDSPAFWIATVAGLVFVAAAGVILYFLWQQVYIKLTGSTTIFEISEQPLQPGQTAEIYISHQAGRLPVEQIEVTLNCEETTRTRVQSRSNSSDSSYEVDVEKIYEAVILERRNIHLAQDGRWEENAEIFLPASARSSTGLAEYPGIRWWFAVRVVIPNAPDFTIDYNIEVK